MFTEQLKERDSIAGTPIHPASLNGAQNSGTVDMSKFNRVQFMGGVGTLGTNATIDARLEESDNSNGASGVNITGASITQINAANKHFTIEVRADQLSKRYVRCVVTVGVAASVITCYPIGTAARNKPATSNDDASVNERKVT